VTIQNSTISNNGAGVNPGTPLAKKNVLSPAGAQQAPEESAAILVASTSEDASIVNITGNTIFDCDNGITIGIDIAGDDASFVSINENVIYNMNFAGIMAWSAGFIGAEQNEIYNSFFSIGLLNVNVGDIDNNQLHTSLVGIYIEDSFLEIDNNVINNNELGIIIEGPATSSSINSNEFCDNEVAIENDTGSPVNAINNWWGAADGPGGIFGVGSGDSVSTDVTYEPFATEPLFPNSLCSPTRDCIRDGDVNGDGRLTPGDSQCAFDIYLAGELTDGCDIENWVCELIAADPNCNGVISPQDALDIFERYLIDGDPEECFAGDVPDGPANGNPILTFSADIAPSAQKGSKQTSIRFALSVSNARALDAFGLTLSYPVDKLKFRRVTSSATTAEWTSIGGQENETGKVILGGFNADSDGLSDGDLMYVEFQQVSDAAILASDISIESLQDDIAEASIEVNELTLAVTELIPDNFELGQNYPNPFNPTTKISFGIPAVNGGSVQTTLTIFNISGQMVRTLLNEETPSGMHEIEWNGQNNAGIQVPSGAYFYTIEAGDFRQTRKMLLLK